MKNVYFIQYLTKYIKEWKDFFIANIFNTVACMIKLSELC